MVSEFPCSSKTAFMKKPQRLEKTQPPAMNVYNLMQTQDKHLTKEECAPNRKGFVQLSSPFPADAGLLMPPSTSDMSQEEKENRKKKENELDEVSSVKEEQVTLGHA